MKNNKINEEERIAEMLKYEKQAYQEGYTYVAGVDEVGRGPIAGPVVAAAVILPPDFYLAGVNDSKKLSPKKREALSIHIKKKAISWAVGFVYSPLLDNINIYNATKEAMKLAINGLAYTPDLLLIDAVKLTDINIKQKNIVKGDSLSVSIASASIIAKVERDMTMQNFDKLYPYYGFAKHKGYATQQHLKAVMTNGPCFLHRTSFEPIKSILSGGESGELKQPNLFK